MRRLFTKISMAFYQTPIIFTLVISFVPSALLGILQLILSVLQNYDSGSALSVVIFFSPLFLSFILSIENVLLLFSKPKSRRDAMAVKRWELAAIMVGAIFSGLFLMFTDITPNDWSVQLYNNQLHSPIHTSSFFTVVTIAVVAFIGYLVLRFVPLKRLPPLLAVLCISALYLGIAVALLWCIQIFNRLHWLMFLLYVFPLNCVVIAIRTIRQVVGEAQGNTYKNSPMTQLLNHAANWPWLAFLTALPLLGIIVAVLLLFGQEPDSFIKAWTETADWTMSQKVAPQNIIRDEHYLCTVAAGGHREVVKPIRTGKRHGHEVIVNRQLCVANAFEQLLEERLPRFHRAVRTTYDTVGYPIARHIHSPYVADAIYVLMKPLEWCFLIVLYLFDAKPENRIAIQYPHAALPPVQ